MWRGLWLACELQRRKRDAMIDLFIHSFFVDDIAWWVFVTLVWNC